LAPGTRFGKQNRHKYIGKKFKGESLKFKGESLKVLPGLGSDQ